MGPIFGELQTLRGEVYQYSQAQEGQDDQNGTFQVAASVDKLHARIETSLKSFGGKVAQQLGAMGERITQSSTDVDKRLEDMRSGLSAESGVDQSLITRLEELEQQVQASRDSLMGFVEEWRSDQSPAIRRPGTRGDARERVAGARATLARNRRTRDRGPSTRGGRVRAGEGV
ncbi:MAG: hypothetical protein R3E96_12965 [Planctomycetota bacterium]